MLQSTFFTILSLVGLTACLPAGVFVSDKGEVGASWGGYSASAGLGGLAGGSGAQGGLHAEAGTPGGLFAAAGLGGKTGDGIYTSSPPLTGGSSSSASSASSAASSNVGGNHGKPGGTLFDDIFNIPQTVLRSVNDLLNRRGGLKKGAVQTSHPVASADYLPSASNNLESNVKTGTLYDDIFNIPQSALRSVNQLLNQNANGKTTASQNGIVTRNTINPSSSANGSTLYNDIFNIPQSVLSAVTRLLNRN